MCSSWVYTCVYIKAIYTYIYIHKCHKESSLSAMMELGSKTNARYGLLGIYIYIHTCNRGAEKLRTLQEGIPVNPIITLHRDVIPYTAIQIGDISDCAIHTSH